MAGDKHPIEPRSEDFNEILGEDRPFVVPRYQRAYDWEAEEVRDWARDLLIVARRRLAGDRRRHFFGAIISVSHDVEKEYEIVDGQQRLTTEILSLAELDERYLVLAVDAKSAGETSVASAANKAAGEIAKRLKTESGAQRLTLSRRDKHYFMRMLDGTAERPPRDADASNKKLWAAREILKTDLFNVALTGASSRRERLKRLDAIRAALLEDGYLVHLFTKDAPAAYQVFMILNDRGRPLSTGALLRTHTLAALAEYPDQQDAAQTDWDAILAAGDPDVDAFLIAYYVSYVGEREAKGELFRAFRDQFLGQEVESERAATALRRAVTTLRAEMEVFKVIRAGAWPYQASRLPEWEKDRLHRLIKALAHHLANPLLLAAARTVDEKAFRTLILMLEPFVFRYINVVGASATALQGEYYAFATKTRTDKAFDRNGFRNALRRLLRERATDPQFEVQLREQLRFTDKAPRKKLIAHFLTTLEDYEQWYVEGAKGTPKVYDKARAFKLGDVNIEHIYPQNPKTVNRAMTHLTHMLGNLTLLDKNQGGKAGSDEFRSKKPFYAKSNFKITQALTAFDDWDPDAVDERFNAYADRAKAIFVVD